MKKVLATVLVLCMLLTCASFPAMAETTNPYRVKIFTMGDSFTQGVIEPNAYRYYIYENLIKDGAVFEFIGKESSGDFRVTSLYNRHGGVGGAVIGHSEDVKWNGSSWVTSSWEYTNPETGKTIKYGGTKNSIWYRLFAGSDGTNDYTKTEYGNYVAQADIVTLYIGLNDYYSSGTNGLSADIEHVKQRYYTVVDRIYEINPDVSLYVTDLNEVSGLRGYGKTEAENTDYANSLYKYNEFVLNDVVEHYTEKGYKIQGISLNQDGYKLVSGDTPSDDGHPNNKGNRKIGTQIYMAIKDEVLELNEQEGETYNPARITSVTLDKTSLTLKTGENATVTSTIAPTNAEIISVIFSSSDESVATIDDYGRITAVSAGTATIYATALDSLRPGATKIEATCAVTVTSEQHTNVGENFLPVVDENFSTTSAWTGSTELIATASKAYKHTTSNSSSQIISKRSYDLKEGFSMSFKAALTGAATKDVTTANKNGYYVSLAVGKYELRVSINGKVVGFYYEGELVKEQIFAVAPVRQNDDKYTLAKYEDKVYVYRNNELLFTADVNLYDTAEGNVILTCKGANNNNIRDLQVKSIYGLKQITPTIKYSSTVTTSGETNYPATNAIDGQLNTRYSIFAWKDADAVAWDSASNYLILDLGDEYDISDLNIYWGGHPSGVWGATAPDAYNVSYSSDNVTYTPALSYSGIHAIINGEAEDTFTSNTTAFAMNYPSWASAADRTTYSYGTVKEAELGWEGVRYVKIQMTSINRNPSISEIEVYTKAYLEGEEPEGTKADYTVNYVDSQGNPLADSKTGSGYIGGKVTENAVEISGYLPDEATKSIIIAEGENVITFVYELVPEKLPLTGANVIAQSGWGWTNNGAIEGSADVLFDGEDATNTKGYFTHSYFSGAFSGTYYIELDLGAVYDISHIVIQGGAPDWNYAHITNYAIYTAGADRVYNSIPAGKQEHGDTITSANKVRTDTTDIKTNDVRYIKIQIVDASYRRPCLGEIEVYRSMEEIPEPAEVTYTVNYVDTEGNPVATAKNGTGNVGDVVTENAVAVDGYTPDKNSATITLIDGTNTITFTYTKVEATVAVDIFPIYASSNYAPQDSVNFIGSAFDGVATADWGRYFRPAKTFAQSAAKGADTNFQITVDLGSPYNLTELYQKWGANYATKVAVYGSNDQTNWTEIADITRSAQESTDAISHTGYYRYVKVEAYSYTTSNCPAILELAFKGTLSPDYEKASLTVNSAPQNKTASTTKENITDGTLTKVFSSSLYNGSITAVNNYNVVLELEKATAIDRLTIFWGNRPEWGHVAPDSYTVYVSADGTNYTPLKDQYTGMLAIATAGEDTTYTDSDTAVFCTSRSETNHRLAVSEYNLNTEKIKFIKIEVNSFKYSFSIAEIEVFAKNEGGTTEPDEPEIPDEPEKEPITITPAGVSAPANTSARPFAYATDGDDTTFYANANYHDSVSTVNYQYVFDIGYLGTVDSLDILWGDSSWGNTTPNAYKVEVSSDGTTWTQKKSYSGIYDITKGAATDTISGENTVFGITTSSWAITNQPTQANAYTQGNILEKNLGWTDVRYVRVTVTSVQYRLAIAEVTISSLPNEDQVILSKGGQIRIADTDKNITAGLRFGASIIKMNTGIEGEYKYSEDAELKFGMFMLPADLLGSSATLTAYLANGVQDALDIPAEKIYSQDENFITFTAVLTGIPETAYDRDIVAVPYMLRGGEYTYFDEMTKSYKGVATSALETTYNPNTITAMADSAEKTALREVSYQLQYIQRGYDKPYTEQGERIIAKLKRGMNMQGLDASTWSSWDSHISTVTSSSTYQNIKNAGFDHVRIPVDLRNATDSNGNINTSKMTTYVDKAVDAAIENGLVVLLDFHGWADIMLTDFDRFVAIWTSVATYYKDKYPEDLIFELVNEPHTAEESDGDGGDLDLTNLVTLQTRTIEAIRAIDPDRFICLATSGWNGIWTLKDKDIGSASMFRNTPLMNYQDTIVALHCYTPGEFTHQDMSWAGTGGQTYSWSENQEAYEAAIKEELGYLVEFVEETGMHAILNEFGCNTGSSVSDADEAAYAKAVVSCIKDNDKIAYTWWEYEQSFGMTSNGSWKTHILNEVMAD